MGDMHVTSPEPETERVLAAISGIQQHIDRRVDNLEKSISTRFERQRTQTGEICLRLERIHACAEAASTDANEAKANGKDLRKQFTGQQLKCEKRFGAVPLRFWAYVASIFFGLITVSGLVIAVLRLVK